MIIQLTYKTTIISCELDENTVKIQDFKEGFKNSLFDYKKNSNLSNSVYNKTSKTAMSSYFSYSLNPFSSTPKKNKNDSSKTDKKSSNPTMKIDLSGNKQGSANKDTSKSANKNDKNELISDCEYIVDYNPIINEIMDEKFSLKIFFTNEKDLVVEKKDSDFFKVESSMSPEKKQIISVFLVRVLKIDTTIYKIKEEKTKTLENKKKSKWSPEELIMLTTGAKEKLKTDKFRNQNLNAFNDNTDIFLQALMGGNNDNNHQGINLLRDLLLSRSGRSNSNITISNQNSNSNTNNNNINLVQQGQNVQNQILRTLMRINNRPPVVQRTVTADATKLQQLIEMGFDEQRARRALIMTRNNIEAAVEVIASDQDLAFPDEEESSNNNQQNNQPLNDNDEDIVDEDIDHDLDFYEDDHN